MGSQIDYAALPVIAEMLGVDDMEMLVDHLQLIEQFQREQNES